MRRNTGILIVSFVAACVVFLCLTVVQNRLIHYEGKVQAFVAKADVSIDTGLTEDMFKVVEIPISLASDYLIVKKKDDFIGKFTKEPIYQGQILFLQTLADEERVFCKDSIAEKEKVAIKLKSSENCISYQIKPEMKIQLYYTAQYGAIEDILKTYGLQNDMFQENSLYTFRLLKDEEVLGVFDEAGESIFSDNFDRPDTIVVSVDENMARLINNLRSQGNFDITV